MKTTPGPSIRGTSRPRFVARPSPTPGIGASLVHRTVSGEPSSTSPGDPLPTSLEPDSFGLCTIPPAYTLDRTRCFANLGHASTYMITFSSGSASFSTKAFYYTRWLQDETETQKFSIIEADYGTCLPPNSRCEMAYTGSGCPEGFSQGSVEVSSTWTTSYCCPSASAFYSITDTVFTYTSAGHLAEAVMPACYYQWSGTTNSLNPTAPYDSEGNRWVALGALTISTSSRSSPSSASTNTTGPLSSLQTVISDSPATKDNTQDRPATSNEKDITIGASVGVVSLLVICALLLFFLIRRRTRLKRRTQDGEYNPANTTITDDAYTKPELDASTSKPEMDATPLHKHAYVAQVVGSPVFELPDVVDPTRPTFELPGGDAGTTLGVLETQEMEAERENSESELMPGEEGRGR